MIEFLSKLIFFKILRWKISGNRNFAKNSVKKAVIIIAPHTSWHDFYVAVLARSVTNIKSKSIYGTAAGQWSARKAQAAVKEYKKAGGGYIGGNKSENLLNKWIIEDWRTKSGKKS